MLARCARRTFYPRLRGAVNYVILIPALLYFISLGLPRRFERAVRVRVALEMPQRGHSAQTRAGVLLHEQDSEPGEREISKKTAGFRRVYRDFALAQRVPSV